MHIYSRKVIFNTIYIYFWYLMMRPCSSWNILLYKTLRLKIYLFVRSWRKVSTLTLMNHSIFSERLAWEAEGVPGDHGGHVRGYDQGIHWQIYWTGHLPPIFSFKKRIPLPIINIWNRLGNGHSHLPYLTF